MTSLDVIGGLYGEICRFPAVKEIYGSGGRAAIALADAGHEVSWHYYCPIALQAEARIALAVPRLAHYPRDSTCQVSFAYMHPLSRPIYCPREIPASPPIKIDAKRVLRFGMMEGDAVVVAQACVYDPQSLDPIPFGANGSAVETLAVVLNHEEVLRYAGASDEDQAIQRMATELGCSVVLVKAGVNGCRVYENGRLTAMIPPYRSDRVYKIGTGDIFSAAFAGAWLLDGREAVASADHASRCVARYAETRNASAARSDLDKHRKSAPIGCQRIVHITGSTSTMSSLWLMEEAREALQRLGVTFSSNDRLFEGHQADVFEAMGEIGARRHMAVLALLDPADPAALLEVGYAVSLGLPVVAYAQGELFAALTRSYAPNLEVCDDFSTALYHVMWAAWS